ncbi:CBS domain-containing protein [Arundinibacter roseus]|uniref:CBS domain-containing protein n=1 Tax=Arundinibacter roseus TaxID=2070510 RepID=A0A4R4KD63_9BACT|nr:CBS domain-containing protein [Arundinibacter roseus]TDB65824.1 CBS domain-containing protein [Arundinibacter roseus]
MKRREPISHIMTNNVLTVSVTDDLQEVVDLLNHKKIRHVPVVEGDSIVGMISRTDMNRLTFSSLFEGQEGADEAILTMLSISQVMTHKPRVVKADQIIRDVAEIFTEEEFHALPVLDENDKLVGIVTTTDLIKYMLEQY